MAKVKKKTGVKNDEEKRIMERERKRRYREKIKEDNAKIEKIKESDRDRKRKSKEEGKIKSIKDMSEREKRLQRKGWRLATKKYRQSLKRNGADLFLYTPPSSPDSSIIQPLSSSTKKKIAAQRKVRQRREKDKRLINKTQKALEKAKRKAEKWRKRYKRLQEKESNASPSPKKIVEQIIKSGHKEVRRNLMLGVSLCKQLKENSAKCSTQEQKKHLADNISGNIISQKKLKGILEQNKIVSTYYQREACKEKNRERKKKTTHISKLEGMITDFFEDAENSCETPGKRDYVTRKKIQKQKRYLLFTMKNLHKKFIEKTGIKTISYQTFVKLKPFWVVHKKLHQRDTCMCITHANFKLKVSKLKLLRLLKTDSLTQILKNTVCDVDNKSCMFGTCKNCNLIIPEELLTEKNFKDFNTFFYRWVRKQGERRSKKGKVVTSTMTVKEKCMCKASELILEVERDIKKIAIHTFNMHHQHKTFKELKRVMTENEAIILCDWSENYQCKYGEEVQAIHFGASRSQISLHTGVVYIGICKPLTEISTNEKKLFCTVSDNTSHNAVSIWAHLVPILSMINNEFPQVKILHFFSDGPTSQYRNKTNFFLMCKICSNFDFQLSTWNFWEAGHGKGPADGIGGLVKRTCDRAVAMGEDVTNAAGFIKTISNLNINTFIVEDYEVSLMSFNITTDLDKQLLAVKGTLQLKCVQWMKKNGPFSLRLSEHTCAICRLCLDCTHHKSTTVPTSWDLIQKETNKSIL